MLLEESKGFGGGWCCAVRWLVGLEAPARMRTRLQPGGGGGGRCCGSTKENARPEGRKCETNSDNHRRSMTEATVVGVEAPPRRLRVDCFAPLGGGGGGGGGNLRA